MWQAPASAAQTNVYFTHDSGGGVFVTSSALRRMAK
jgi:hypothetical protein